MSTEKATAFWKSQAEYPFQFTRRRRLHELNYLVPRLERSGSKRLLDLGCGDGSLLECLLRITDFEALYGYDVSAELLRGIDPRIHTAVYDIATSDPLPEVDVIILASVIQYVFDDDIVNALFARMTAPVAWIRSTCTLKPQRDVVVKDGDGGYAACYRTLPEVHAMISRHFDVVAVDRVYPDELESAFGNRQFYFEARRKHKNA